MKKRIVLPILAFLCVAIPAFAASVDPMMGGKLAKTECVACHAVGGEADAKSPEPKAPRFVDVASMPSTTELSIKVFLRSSHRSMPNIMLSDEEIDSVASYILGLRTK